MAVICTFCSALPGKCSFNTSAHLLRNLVEVQFASLSIERLFSQVLMSFHTSVLDLVTFSIEVKEK